MRALTSEGSGPFVLSLVLCIPLVLDVHASARREAPRSVEVPITAAVPAREVAAPASPVSAPPAQRAAGGEVVRHSANGVRAYTKREVQELIRRHARAFDVDPELPLAIAQCESGFRWNAANTRSSARGVFQYLSGTWRSTPEGRKGTSVLNTDAHVRMAVAHIAKLGTAPWNASRSCWAVTLDESEDPPAAEGQEVKAEDSDELQAEDSDQLEAEDSADLHAANVS